MIIKKSIDEAITDKYDMLHAVSPDSLNKENLLYVDNKLATRASDLIVALS